MEELQRINFNVSNDDDDIWCWIEYRWVERNQWVGCRRTEEPGDTSHAIVRFPVNGKDEIGWKVIKDIPADCPDNPDAVCSIGIPRIRIYDIKKTKIGNIDESEDFVFSLYIDKDRIFLSLKPSSGVDEDMKDITDIAFEEEETMSELEFKVNGRIFMLSFKVELITTGILYEYTGP